MSHEIRTPLNGVIGFTELLEKTPTSNIQKKYLNSIKISSKVLLVLINDVLDLSKIEAGKVLVTYKPMYISSLCDELNTIFESKAKEKNNELKFNISKKTPNTIIFNDIRLRQILLNIISNALKFTNNGLVEVNIDVKNKKKNSTDLFITIKDNGIGIPNNEKDIIFKPFYQIKTSSQNEGTGLGLAIVKKLVEVLNGKIKLESSKGIGSTFILEFFDIEILKSTTIDTGVESILVKDTENSFSYNSNNNSEITLNFNTFEKELLVQLVELQKNELKVAKESNMFSQFYTFNKRLREISIEFNDDQLKKYSKEFSLLVKHFDIEGIEKYIKSFDSEINKKTQ
jgi:anti-sigma regulatory factor (Ser/Thr protein kinase)